MSQPWMKFYPRDWRGDQALRAVCIAARGLWMECLCIMHEAKPYGHLVLNGEPVEGDTLARMTGTSVDEVSALMAELRKAGVLSVTSKGVVFSRRMTKDHARAQKGRSAAKRRWSQALDDVEQSGAPNRSPNREPITQKPEARVQKGDANASLVREFEREFHEQFWPEYPLKVGKPHALKAFVLARRRANLETIMAGTRRYAAERAGQDKKFTKQAQGWLNRDGWADEPIPAGSMQQRATSPPLQTLDSAVDEIFRERGWTDEPGVISGAASDVSRVPGQVRGREIPVVDLRAGVEWDRR